MFEHDAVDYMMIPRIRVVQRDNLLRWNKLDMNS